jgi:serine/threonine protein kinase/WD40 repeat protein
MALPSEDQWLRVEELAEKLGAMPPEAAAEYLNTLKNQGESATTVSMVGSWLSLTPLATPISEGRIVAHRYTLLKKIGEGGMGTVWSARQDLIGRDVAVKMLHPALISPALHDRFLREMGILGRLEHHGIVKIFDAGVHHPDHGPDIPFYAMELVDGAPLDRWADDHRCDRARVLHVVSDICAAIQHAHDRGVVHRDLKPANIIVDRHDRVVVLDFGIARLATGEPDEAGVFAGTPHYAAPEQHLGRDRDFRSGESVDVYAAGAIIFEVLAGRRLFVFPRGTSIAEMRRTIIEDMPPRLSEVIDDCPPLLDEIVARAVRRSPADRYYSIAALGRALQRAAATLYGDAEPVPPRWIPAEGTVVPGTNWKLTRRIGQGGAGEVWMGRHEQLDERRVFKFCDTEEKARTLKREMTLFRLLKERVGRNPHFIQYHEVSLDEAPWYLMMEDADALDLESWCDRQSGGLRALDVETRIEIVAEAAEALQSAHEAGIIHRDVKPANILIRDVDGSDTTRDNSRPGKRVHIIIADFGIGQILTDQLLGGGTRLGFTATVSGLRESGLAGTMLYLAPEVTEGHAATARSDIYSLGIVLWQLLIDDLHVALDPAKWAHRIRDPLLREDLNKCLAGVSDERWASAGDLAASLRSLPDRRAAEAQRQAELAVRERNAYRRGLYRATAIAAAVLAIVSLLAATAWIQSRNAKLEKARGALKQADNVSKLENKAGRRSEGLNLLAEATTVKNEGVAIRTIAARLLSLVDLDAVPFNDAINPPSSPRTGETMRVADHGGNLVAVGRDSDGLQGTVDLLDATTGDLRSTVRRTGFPGVPIPEPELVQFSPDDRLLAIAGPETSLHILLCAPATGTLHSYLFARGGLKCFAWHPGGRIVATGNSDRAVRIWDIESRRDPTRGQLGKTDLAFPPDLAVPAIDLPVATIKGWRERVCSLAFNPEGTYLAALDEAGLLRIIAGFGSGGLPGLPPAAEAPNAATSQSALQPYVLLETNLGRAGPRSRVRFVGSKLVVTHPESAPIAFEINPGSLFREQWIGGGIREFAWSHDGRQLCGITETDIYWMTTNPLAPYCIVRGKNPIGVAYDSSTGHWVLPNHEEVVLRVPTGSNSSKSVTRISFPRSADRAESRYGVAGTAGRFAIYHGNRLLFIRDGKFVPAAESIRLPQGARFSALLWDHKGTMATIVSTINGQLHADSYRTVPGSGPTSHTIRPRAQRLVTAEDGAHLIERSIERGISRIDAASGESVLLDGSHAARQDAPIAASADGLWIAAVMDRHVVRLLTSKGVHYADLPVPRDTTLTFLSWHHSGQYLAALTDDGFVQVWSMSPWREWIEEHGLTSSQ